MPNKYTDHNVERNTRKIQCSQKSRFKISLFQDIYGPMQYVIWSVSWESLPHKSWILKVCTYELQEKNTVNHDLAFQSSKNKYIDFSWRFKP